VIGLALLFASAEEFSISTESAPVNTLTATLKVTRLATSGHSKTN
jgi:hypothetical protein